MRITKSRKAVFFTMISIVLVVSLFFFYTSSTEYYPDKHAGLVETRVLTMDSFIDDIEHDIERGLYISSIRCLIGMAEYLTENGTFLREFDPAFNEVMLNGTLQDSMLNITKNATLMDWIHKIEDIGQKLNIDVAFSDISISAYHESPWDVEVRFMAMVNLTDIRGIASWSRLSNVTTTIDITDFEDPLYTVTSKGKLTNSIIKSNISDFVSGEDASNLVMHANSSWYIASDLAPSFLMRFVGNLSASPDGIESIVNVADLQVAAPEIYKTGRSSVDYLYFANETVSSCKINETKDDISWFRLDDDHLATYEANCES